MTSCFYEERLIKMPKEIVDIEAALNETLLE